MANQDTANRTLDDYLPEPGVDSRVELYVQTLAPVENYKSQGRLVDALTALQDNGALGDVTVTVWGDRICTNGALSTIDDAKHIVEMVGDLYAFAAEEDISISPFFKTTTVDASISGQSFKSIVPPSRCIAMYEGETLVGVFPCFIEGESVTVRDAIDRLSEKGLEAVPEKITPE